jgi:glycerol-3-phosphate dehydrogenase subunit C
LLTHAFRFMPLGARLHALANPLLRAAWARRLAERLFGIDRRAPLPPFASPRFSALARSHVSPPARHRVAYFYGCYTDSNDPQVGLAALRVLEAAGVQVHLPSQTCCGAALLGAGNLAAARKQAEKNIAALRVALAGGCEAIVVGSPSCALSLSREMVEMLGLDCTDVQEKVVDLFAYLDRLDAAGELRLRLRPMPVNAAYHEACHLTALGFGARTARVLANVPEFRVRVLDAGCCGLAGTFGLKKKTAPIARRIGEDVARRIAEWRPEVVLSECEGCRMQITYLTGVRTKHPIEVLADALPNP